MNIIDLTDFFFNLEHATYELLSECKVYKSLTSFKSRFMSGRAVTMTVC